MIFILVFVKLKFSLFCEVILEVRTFCLQNDQFGEKRVIFGCCSFFFFTADGYNCNIK